MVDNAKGLTLAAKRDLFWGSTVGNVCPDQAAERNSELYLLWIRTLSMAEIKYKRKEETKECVECGSLYYPQTSEMKELCPECAHYLYGKKNCDHQFNFNRCVRCYWDGSVSRKVRQIKKERK